MAESDGPPRAALIAALVLAIGAVVVILAIAATRQHTAPVVVAAVPAPLGATISYGPSLSPEDRGMGLIQFSVAHQEAPRSCVTAYPDRTLPPISRRNGRSLPSRRL